MNVRAWWWLAAVLALLLALACQGQAEPTPTPTGDIVYRVPWEDREETTYRILRGEEVTGRGVITIERQGRVLVIRQEYTDVGGRFRDVVTATVDAVTLKPQVVERVLTGPDGERRWRAQYEDGKVSIFQESDGESRSDELILPPHSYDSWTDIALWRTLPLDYGFRAAYVDVGTALLRKPDTAIMVVEVVSKESVTVPAGTFVAWRLQARSDEHTQTVWIADTPERPVVRYDNGTHVFELEEMR